MNAEIDPEAHCALMLSGNPDTFGQLGPEPVR